MFQMTLHTQTRQGTIYLTWINRRKHASTQVFTHFNYLHIQCINFAVYYFHNNCRFVRVNSLTVYDFMMIIL